MISTISVCELEGKLYPYRPPVTYLLTAVTVFFTDIFYFRERSNNSFGVWALLLMAFGIVAHALIFVFTGSLFSLLVALAVLTYLLTSPILETVFDNYVSHITAIRGTSWRGKMRLDADSWFLYLAAFISTGIGDCYNLGPDRILFYGSRRSLYKRIGKFYYELGITSVYVPDHPLVKLMDDIFQGLYPCLKK